MAIRTLQSMTFVRSKVVPIADRQAELCHSLWEGAGYGLVSRMVMYLQLLLRSSFSALT